MTARFGLERQNGVQFRTITQYLQTIFRPPSSILRHSVPI
jgi:hypothetical protein